MKTCETRRRDVLKALGVGMGCLPLLRSGQAAAAAPRRLIIVASTEGYRQPFWRPMDGSLLGQTLPDSTSPLEPHKADLIFLPGLTHPSFTGGGHGSFPNHLATSNSGVREYRVPTSATFDQVVGPALAKPNNLPMATLNLGILSDKGIMGEGANSRYCFAKGKDQIVVPEQDPWKTYARVFAGAGAQPTGPDPAVARLLAQKKSILDYVGRDLDTFAVRVGKEDGDIVRGHMSAIRDLERDLLLVRADVSMCGGAMLMPKDATAPINYPATLNVNFDLMVAALKCDVTRVAALQMVDAGGANLPWNFLPEIPERGRRLSHAPAQLARPRAQPDPRRDRPQAHRRQVVHDPARRAHRPPEGHPRRGRHHAVEHRRADDQSHGRRPEPQQPQAALDPGRAGRRLLPDGSMRPQRRKAPQRRAGRRGRRPGRPHGVVGRSGLRKALARVARLMGPAVLRAGAALGIAALGLLLGCSTGEALGPRPSAGAGGQAGSGGTSPGSVPGGANGSAGAGGTEGPAGGAGGGPAGAGSPDTGAGGPPAAAGGSTAGSGTTPPSGPVDYGGVGQQPLIPLAYTTNPVPPLVAMDCPEDPTAGFTEYKDSFVVQRPRDLAARDRFKYEDGVYTVWVLPGDQPHKPNNNTKPRTETRFSDLGTGEHLFSADVMVEPGTSGTVVQQFKSAGTRGGNIGTYLQVNGGTMRDRAGTVASNVNGKWINIKVAFDIPTGLGRIWLNNCLKVTTQKEKNALWYFKFGTYHCDGASVCRASFKNIRLYQKGSTDRFNVKSPIP